MTAIHVCTNPLTYWYAYMQVKSMKGPHLFNSTPSPNVWTMSSRISKNKIFFPVMVIKLLTIFNNKNSFLIFCKSTSMGYASEMAAVWLPVQTVGSHKSPPFQQSPPSSLSLMSPRLQMSLLHHCVSSLAALACTTIWHTRSVSL